MLTVKSDCYVTICGTLHTALTGQAVISCADCSMRNVGTLGNASNPVAYTVFAPTNEAIEALLADQDTTVAALQESGELDDILQYHFLIEPYTVRFLSTIDISVPCHNVHVHYAVDGCCLPWKFVSSSVYYCWQNFICLCHIVPFQAYQHFACRAQD